MIPEIRKKYNSEFNQKKYSSFLDDINSYYNYKIEFRISETPIFIPKDFRDEILKAAEEILSSIFNESYLKTSHRAIPQDFKILNKKDYPDMFALDFAISRDKDGKYIPYLIELQGFPSLYCYQEFLAQMFRKHFYIPAEVTNYFNGDDHDSYIRRLKEKIIGFSNPENVILLEIEPHKQKTRIDFSCTEDWLGIKAVCITEIVKKENRLYYRNEGKTIPIEKIYNRVIFDELMKRKDLNLDFSFNDELEVNWIPHPDWFFRISKFTLPYLKNKYVPETFFLDEINLSDIDHTEFVLKPLFSFAGSGVIYDLTKEILENVTDKKNYIIQQKINYEPVIETPDVPAKAELRLLYIWENKPKLINSLVRLSKGKMMGVDFNKDKTWVGSSTAFFEN